MRTIRRFYFYLVALISLEVVIWGLINLLRTMFATNVLIPAAETMAQALALIVVGLLIFPFHWLWAQRAAAHDDEERTATLRAVFLYAVLLATLIPIVADILAIIDRVLIASVGLEPSRAMLGAGQTWKDNLISIVLNGIAAAYFFTILRADWQVIKDTVNFAGVRRLYRYVWVLFGLSMTIFGVQQVLSFLMFVPSALIGATGHEMVINGVALIVVGALIWAGMWTLCQNALQERGEQGSILRLTVLYLLALTSVITVLTSAGLFVDILLRFALGESMTLQDFLQRVNNPVSIGVPLAAVWAYYGFWLGKEIDTVSDTPRRAGLKRFYFYILALIGLVATFVGLSLLFSFIIDTLTGSSAIWGETLRPRLAGAIATLLTALPLWVLTWRPMQAETFGVGDEHDHARRSLVRKLFLYLVIFASVIGCMVSGVILVYQLLNALLSQNIPDHFLSTVLNVFQVLALFAAFLVYHLTTLRRDSGQAADSLASRHAGLPVLVLEHEVSGFAAYIQALISRTAAGVPVAAGAIEHGIPAGANSARAVVLPAALALDPPEVLRIWLKDFAGHKIIVPAEDTGWLFWPAGRDRQQLVRQLADGQEVSAPAGTAPWQIVAYIFAALFALQLALGVLLVGLSILLR